MTQEEALKRLHWRFSQGKAFKPNQNDANALNLLFDWMTRQKKINVLNNTLCSKLYISALAENIRTYNTTVFDMHPQKDLSRVLSYPLEYFYDAFYRQMCLNQTKEDVKKGFLTLDDLKEKYTREIVEDKLDHMISEAINKFS